MKRDRKIRIALGMILIVGVLLSACTSARKLAESGKYDEAIEYLVKKLRGKKKKSPEKVKLLEYAFSKAQARDFRQIRRLESSNRAENWPVISDIYDQIGHRQNLIEPLTPLTAKDGYTAQFDFVDVVQAKNKADDKSRSFLYENAKRMLQRYEKSKDKYYAREAFGNLEELHVKYGEYKDSRLLQDQAYDKGMDHYFIQIENKSDKVLPVSFARTLSDVPRRDFEKNWKQIDPVRIIGKKYDYAIVYEINDVEISPDMRKEREFEETKVIEEEASGQTIAPVLVPTKDKDKKAKPTKLKVKIEVKAKVLEVFQHKSAWIRGVVRIFRERDRGIVFSEPLESEYVFEHYASKLISGDERALSDETRGRLGNHPVPFPSDDDFLYDAARYMKNKFFAIFKRFNPSTGKA